jgi:hypothetical protein
MKKIIFLLLITSSVFFSQKKIAYAVKVDTAPVLDGFIDEDVWRKAIPINDFTQQEPKNNSPVSLQTEVRILYDDKYLYISFMCFDDEPEKIVARELKWDGKLRGDDNIRLLIDTFNDDKSAYWFSTNPLGTQNDALMTGSEMSGFNEDWDAVWDAESQILDNGWSTELCFPFSTFKFYDKEEQVWGINFQREIRRYNEDDLWASVGPNLGLFKISEAGDLVGLKNISRGNPVYLMLFYSSGVQITEGSKKYVNEPGVDIKYGITKTLSLDITANTDFAQVEADRARINLSRFPLFYPEKRDFFLEGAKIFDFSFGDRDNLFYSRRIGINNGNEIPIIGGAKLVGRVDDFEIGLINMQTAEKNSVLSTNYSVARFKYDLFGQSTAGMMFTSNISKKSFNNSVGADFNFAFTDFLEDQNLVVHLNFAKTNENNGKDDSWAGNFYIDYPNDLIDQFAAYRFFQNNFNPDMGFVARKGLNEYFYKIDVTPRINWNGIKKLTFRPFYGDWVYDFNNKLIAAEFSITPFGFITNQGDKFNFDFERSFDLLEEDFNVFGNTVIRSGNYWSNIYKLELETSSGRNISGQIETATGDFYGGKIKSFNTDCSVTISKHLSLYGDYQYNYISIKKNSFSTNEFGSRITYNFSTKLNSSLFAQWNNELDEILINYRINWKPKIGSDVYLVLNQVLSTQNKISSRDFVIIAKVVWLITV